MARDFERFVEGEKVIFEIRPSWFILLAYLLPLLIAITFLILVFNFTAIITPLIPSLIVGLIGIFVAIVIYLYWYGSIYRLTSRRVENRFGIIGVREEEIAIEDIQSIDVEKSIWGRIFNFGTVLIKASGTNREVDFPFVSDAKRIADLIEEMVLEVRKEEGPRPPEEPPEKNNELKEISPL